MVTPDNSTYARVEDTSTSDQRAEYWRAAEGLQAVDGLETSSYLDEVAQGHIRGEYDSTEAVRIVEEYYERKARVSASALPDEKAAKEADIVSSRIVELLSKASFSFSPSMLKLIHGELFRGLIESPYDYNFRDYDITKSELVLAGESVTYAPAPLIADDLAYDFSQFDYRSFALSPRNPDAGISKLTAFVANIWQVHPFIEGNTRTVAVFVELMLRSKGAEIDNSVFANHALYFRNALVRANYASIGWQIPEDHEPLRQFMSNLLIGSTYKLRNRDLYCDALYEAKGLPSPSQAFAHPKRSRSASSPAPVPASPSAPSAPARSASK